MIVLAPILPEGITEIIHQHRNITRPDVRAHLGHYFEIHPNVFSPFIAPSGSVTLQLGESIDFRRKHVLEVGCGSGVFSCLAASRGAKSVVAIDINPFAIENTIKNARYHSLSKMIDVRHGNVFAPLSRVEKFDVIYIDLPFTDAPATDWLERSFHEPETRALRQACREVKDFLSPQGTAYIVDSNLTPTRVPNLLDYENVHIKKLWSIKFGFIEIFLTTLEWNAISFEYYTQSPVV